MANYIEHHEILPELLNRYTFKAKFLGDDEPFLCKGWAKNTKPSQCNDKVARLVAQLKTCLNDFVAVIFAVEKILYPHDLGIDLVADKTQLRRLSEILDCKKISICKWKYLLDVAGKTMVQVSRPFTKAEKAIVAKEYKAHLRKI